MSLMTATPRLPLPPKPKPMGEPTCVFVQVDGWWYFLVGAVANDYPAGTTFGPYPTAQDAMEGRDRLEIGAFDQDALDAKLRPATRLRLAA